MHGKKIIPFNYFFKEKNKQKTEIIEHIFAGVNFYAT